MANQDYLTIVSGLPRSGTSMMMRMLEAGGIPPIADHVRRADEDNPKGYYEFEPAKKVREDASWLEDAYGKAVKMVYLLLYDLPPDYQYRIVFMRRNLTEIIRSQNLMLKRNDASGADVPDAKMMSLFQAELTKIEQWLSEQPNFQAVPVDYNRLIKDPLEPLRQINQFLDDQLDVGSMAAVVDPQLYRNRELTNIANSS